MLGLSEANVVPSMWSCRQLLLITGSKGRVLESICWEGGPKTAIKQVRRAHDMHAASKFFSVSRQPTYILRAHS